MPAPQASQMKMLAKNNFKSHKIKLAVNWSQPTGDAGKQYVDAFPENERNVPDTSNGLFIPASTNKYHIDQCKTIGKDFEDFIDGICDCICSAWQQWMAAATFTNVIINGPVGIIAPSSLKGPPFFPMSFATSPKIKPTMTKYSKAITNAIGTAWTAWATGFTGKVNYPPTFATCPMPAHIPTPNIPATIKLTGSSPGEAMLDPNVLKMAMIAELGDPTAMHHKELFDAIAKAFKSMFDQWVQSTMVNNVLGIGPVPTFAPPFVPVGPVVVGMGNGIPGSVLA